MKPVRVIPVLLLQNKGLYKTVKFDNRIYIGDPINAVRIFNDKEVDELIFLDIDASKINRKPDFKLIEKIASECFMPLGYGGGITEMTDIQTLFKIGVEKVILNTSAITHPELISEAADLAGNQSVVVSIDIKKNWLGKPKVYSHAGINTNELNSIDYAMKAQALGAGEIILNSVDRDGMMQGFDIELIKQFSSKLEIPVVACGGAGNTQHLKEAVHAGGASAVAAGSLFVFHGPLKGVLINYPNPEVIKNILKNE